MYCKIQRLTIRGPIITFLIPLICGFASTGCLLWVAAATEPLLRDLLAVYNIAEYKGSRCSLHVVLLHFTIIQCECLLKIRGQSMPTNFQCEKFRTKILRHKKLYGIIVSNTLCLTCTVLLSLCWLFWAGGYVACCNLRVPVRLSPSISSCVHACTNARGYMV